MICTLPGLVWILFTSTPTPEITPTCIQGIRAFYKFKGTTLFGPVPLLLYYIVMLQTTGLYRAATFAITRLKLSAEFIIVSSGTQKAIRI